MGLQETLGGVMIVLVFFLILALLFQAAEAMSRTNKPMMWTFGRPAEQIQGATVPTTVVNVTSAGAPASLQTPPVVAQTLPPNPSDQARAVLGIIPPTTVVTQTPTTLLGTP